MAGFWTKNKLDCLEAGSDFSLREVILFMLAGFWMPNKFLSSVVVFCSRPSSFARKGFSSLRRSRSELFPAIRLVFVSGWKPDADRGRLFRVFFDLYYFRSYK